MELPVLELRKSADAPLVELIAGRLGAPLLTQLLDGLNDGVCFATADRRILFWNKGAERITGFRAEEVVGRSCYENILIHTDANGDRLCLRDCPMKHAVEERQPRTTHIFCSHRDGRRIPIVLRTIPIIDRSGRATGIVETFGSDPENALLREEVARLSHAAVTDALTDLPNRRALDDALELAFYRLARHEHRFGVILLDLDNFKEVNDRLGHSAGDALLRAVAQALASVRRRDEIVGRWGGDEFIAIAQPIASPDDLGAAAERLRTVVDRVTVDVGSKLACSTASAGAALVRPGETATSLLLRADRALYRSKALGGARTIAG